MALTLEEERELSQLEKDFESQDISLEPSPNLTVEEQQELFELETEFSQADANPASPTGLTLEEQDEMSQLESEFGSEEPSTGDIVKGVGTEIAVGVGGQMAGTATGAAIGSAVPIVGTAVGAAVGYTIGSIGSGIAGSIAAQKIEGQEDISWGRAIAAGLINLAPGGSAKGVKGAAKITGSMVGKAAAKEAVKGAAFGATEATSRAIIDEGRLPTKEELAQYGGAGALFGGGLGAATPKVSKTFDKFFGKTDSEIGDAIANGEIDYKDLTFVAKQGQVAPRKAPPQIPETRGQGVQYHGTSNPIKELSDVYSTQNIYGQGLYTTDAMDIGRGYSKKGLGENAIIYKTTEKQPVNFFDIDNRYVEEILDPSLRGDPILDEAISEIGEAASVRQLYDFMRKEMDYPADEIQEAFYSIQDVISKKGFGGIKHIGGEITGNKAHNVKIYFDPKNQLSTEEAMRFDVPELTQLKRRLSKLKKSRSDLPYGNQEAHMEWRNQMNDLQSRIVELDKPKPSMEGVIRRDIENITARKQSEAAAKELVKSNAIASKEQGTLGKILASIVPSKYVGAKANQAAIDFKRSITEAEELGSRIARNVKRVIGEDAEINATVNKIIDGEPGVDVSALPKGIQADIAKFSEARLELQEKMVSLLDDGAFDKMDGEARDALMKTVKDSISGKSYARREYKMFLDKSWNPSQAQYDAALNELTESMGAAKAKKHMDALQNASAARKDADPRGFFGAAVDGVLKRKHKVGAAERAWLGEVTDAPERMRGTLSGIAKSVARAEADMKIANDLMEAGIGSTTRTGNMVELTLRGTGKEGTGVYVNPEVQVAMNQIYLPSADRGTENIFLKGLQDLYGASVAGSKASKVLLNTIAYPVQLYGNTANLLGMGINPFKGASRGAHLALAEFGGVERLTKSPVARKAMLDDIQEMSRYGIKNANILESDIRSGLEQGFFSKALSKVTDPLGKAYSVPDTMGRYVGWKANQNTIRKIFPQLNDEQVKRQAAIMINDTYQNYDKLSNTVRTLSRWGVMPQFASFTAEFMRNQYNQGRIIAQMAAGKYGREFGVEASEASVSAMRKEAAKRAASLLAVYGGTYGAIEGVKAASGVDKKKEEAMREAFPDWDTNKSLMIKLDKDGKTGWTANPSYVVPHALGLSALRAGMNGDDQSTLIGLLSDEMIGEGSFVMQEAYRAITNQDRYGRPITNEVSELNAAADKMKFFITELFKPSFSRELKKASLAAQGKGDLTLKEVGARQLGARINPINLPKAFKYKFMDLKEKGNGAKGEYTRMLNKGEASEQEIAAKYEQANRINKDVFDSMVRKDRAMRELDFSETDRIEIMKEAKIGTKDMLSILSGEYRDLPRAKTETSTDIYESLPEDMNQKRRAIQEKMRSTPEMGKRLMAMWKKERRQARKGLTPQQELFSRLGTEDKVTFLRSKRGLVESYRRKGLINEQVIRALAITE